ncbi:MAG: hypothetical protein U9Q74_02150 [Gemmatimonadota bacterium]|nr:hypothetical protein [Gemmatimonadota bacterium]
MSNAEPATPRRDPRDGTTDPAPCDFCGARALAWRKCKLICGACGNINKSCADL